MLNNSSEKTKPLVLLAPLVPESPSELTDPIVDYVRLTSLSNLPKELHDAVGFVAWGVKTPEMLELLSQLPKLQWIQFLSAGTEIVSRLPLSDETVVCSGKSLHDETVSEHALSLLLSASRSLHLLRDKQNCSIWATEFGGVQREPNPDRITTLNQAKVLIWGYGGIARHLTPLLQSLGAEVQGVATSEREENGVRVHSVKDLPSLLPETDFLVMILPNTEATKNILSQELLELLPSRSWVVNVGRGSTIDEEALTLCLQNGHLAGAALDVFQKEPLPKTSPLWQMENVIITPHAAGGRPRGAWQLIAENSRALVDGGNFRNRVK